MMLCHIILCHIILCCLLRVAYYALVDCCVVWLYVLMVVMLIDSIRASVDSILRSHQLKDLTPKLVITKNHQDTVPHTNTHNQTRQHIG